MTVLVIIVLDCSPAINSPDNGESKFQIIKNRNSLKWKKARKRHLRWVCLLPPQSLLKTKKEICKCVPLRSAVPNLPASR